MNYTIEKIADGSIAYFMWEGAIELDDRRNNRKVIATLTRY